MQQQGPSPSSGGVRADGGVGGPGPDLQTVMRTYQASVERRLEEGIRAIQQTADSLMHEIASEVWRAAAGDKDDLRETILQELSHDEAIRGLLAHSDERFQALSTRTARLEEALSSVADSVHAANLRLEQGVEALARNGSGGDDAAHLRAQLAEVAKQVAAALETLAERDQAIVDSVRARIREHGEIITEETTRISRAMESYVQHGVEALGQLAGSMEAQIGAIAERDREVEERVRATFDEQMRLLAEQLQLMYERLALDTTSVTEAVTHTETRVEERTRAVGEYLHLLNDRIDVSGGETASRIAHVIDERVMGLARLVRSDAEALRGEIARVEAEQRQAVTAIAEGLRDQRETMEAAARAVEAQRESVGAIAGGVEAQIGALARLVRADNETLAEQIVADQQVSKQALRAMKELQASLPGEVIEMVEQRFASLAESIERSNEMLAKRIDRMAETLGEQHDTDIQVVIDRMGDAMHALANLGRTAQAKAPQAQTRIELE